MDDCTLAQRLEIARRVKRESCGGREVTDEDLGGLEGDETTPVGFAAAVARAKKRKSANGGIIGVSKAPGGLENPFFAQIQLGCHQKKFFFACAISAAQHRNALAERRWPGIDAFKCDEDAVWERWGCSCGKHERGKA